MRKMLLIPSTFTGEKKDKKIRNFLISQIARAAVTFGINEICVYYDPDPKFDSHGLGRYIVKILKYLNTPPYLRKIAFPLEKELKYVGSCLPIKAKYHIDKENYVYVYVLEKIGDIYKLTDGSNYFEIKDKRNFKSRILVFDRKNKKIIEKYEADTYVGYEVFYYNKTIDKLIEKLKKENFYIIGTSRFGEDIRNVKIEKSKKIAIAFGSFARGFEDIFGEKFKKLFNITINVVPNQLMETIRTEEAVFYTLSILKYLEII